MWCASIPLFAVALAFFILFMFNLRTPNMLRALISIAVATAVYIRATKATTHEKGYTAIQAVLFYLQCRKEGLGKLEMCKKKTVHFKKIAASFEFTKNLELDDLFEMHEIAHSILYKREVKK